MQENTSRLRRRPSVGSRSTRLLALLATATLLAGCGGGDDSTSETVAPPASTGAAGPTLGGTGDDAEGDTSGAPAEEPTAELAAFDPPSRFDLSRPVELPPEATAGFVALAGIRGELPIAVSDSTIYAAGPDRLLVVNGADGAALQTVIIEDASVTSEDVVGLPFVGGNPARPPLLIDRDGDGAADLAAASFTVEQAGSGTSAGGSAVAVVAIDTSSLETTWTATIPIEGADAYTDPGHELVGASGGHLVVVSSPRDLASLATTTVLDLETGEVAWQQAGLRAETVHDDLVVATRAVEGRQGAAVLLGLTADTGAEAWTVRHEALYIDDLFHPFAISSLSPGTLWIQGSDYFSGEPFLLRVSADGAVVDEDLAWPVGECRSADDEVVICSVGDSDVTALDATTLATLWQLPDETTGRTGLEVTTAWHGRVYGRSPNGPVTLDAATGADVEADPGLAPVAVSAYLGVGQDPTTDFVGAFPTAG